MNSLTRRLATVTLAGALAVGSMSGCGIFGSAIDCGKLYSAAQSVGSAGSDPAALRTALDDLEKAAEDVSDADLKQAVKDVSTETKKSLDVLENPESADPSDVGDTKKVNAGLETIQEKCG